MATHKQLNGRDVNRLYVKEKRKQWRELVSTKDKENSANKVIDKYTRGRVRKENLAKI